jgi:hypothetical protein
MMFALSFGELGRETPSDAAIIVIDRGEGRLMERGPLALFGAIVAVGLGPALWLGAQFGNVAVPTDRSPAIISEQKADVSGGAGSAPEDPATTLETRPRSEIKPLSDRPSPRPSGSASTAPEPDDDATTKPPAKTEPTPTDEPTTPPTEQTTAPTDEPSDGETTEPGGEADPPLPPDITNGAAGDGPTLAGT